MAIEVKCDICEADIPSSVIASKPGIYMCFSCFGIFSVAWLKETAKEHKPVDNSSSLQL
jgi:hypothetical protein